MKYTRTPLPLRVEILFRISTFLSKNEFYSIVDTLLRDSGLDPDQESGLYFKPLGRVFYCLRDATERRANVYEALRTDKNVSSSDLQTVLWGSIVSQNVRKELLMKVYRVLEADCMKG